MTHINIGLLLLNERGEIDLLNPATRSLLKLKSQIQLINCKRFLQGYLKS